MVQLQIDHLKKDMYRISSFIPANTRAPRRPLSCAGAHCASKTFSEGYKGPWNSEKFSNWKIVAMCHFRVRNFASCRVTSSETNSAYTMRLHAHGVMEGRQCSVVTSPPKLRNILECSAFIPHAGSR